MPPRPIANATSESDQATMSMQTAAGRRLAAVRNLAGLTQVGLGDVLHVNQSTIAKWETGERMADPSRMSAFCARFKVTMDYLYRGRLEGLPRDLALALTKAHPELVVLDQPDTGERTDKGRS